MTQLGKYELHEQLGRGGFGTVYRAVDTSLNREVALKVLHPQLMVDDDFIERFKKEARTMASLEHPSIVAIHEFGEIDGRVFIAMRYLSGGSLQKKISDEGALSYEKIQTIFYQICEGLQVAHSQKLVHRDIKPANILFDKTDRAVVSDFGLARAVQLSGTSSSVGIVGTPAYRAPELWRGKPPATPAADVYSLGCILVEMLTGKILFDGDTTDEILTQHLIDGPNIPQEFAEGTPDGILPVIEKALAKNPQDRYQSASEFENDLKNLSEPAREIPAYLPPVSTNETPVLIPVINSAEPSSFIPVKKADSLGPPALENLEPMNPNFSSNNNIPPDIPQNTGGAVKLGLNKVWYVFAGLLALTIYIIIFVINNHNNSLPAPTQSVITEAPAATEAPAEAAQPAEPTVLNVWSFTNEMQTMAIAFEQTHPNVDVIYTMIPMTSGEYQTKLMSTLGTGAAPDVVALEAAFVKQYVESDFLADLTDLKKYADELKTYPVVLEVGTDNDVIKAYAYQVTPGAFFYRRSLAKEYFGTDDPYEIQALVADMDKFTSAAEVVKNKSNGNTFMVGSSGDFMNLFYANRAQPWIVDNTLTVDPMVYKMVETAKLFRDNGYESQTPQWTEDWFAGMNDSFKDADGNAKQIFCYFLPSWGLPYVLSPNSTSADGSTTTFGDWAMINGPMPYQWGGTWVGAMKESDNLEMAKEFVRFVALDEDNLTNWATGVYTNEYLKAIDPNTPDDQAQAAGDFVSSQVVVEKITSGFGDSSLSEFLGGQNSYGAFAAAAPSVTAKSMQGSDDAIQRALNDPLNYYLGGFTTEEEMWSAWKDAVRAQMPDLIVN